MHLLLWGLLSSLHVLIKFFAKQNYTLNETQGGIPWTILITQKIYVLITQKIYVRAPLINRK